MEKKASNIDELINVISKCKKKEISRNKEIFYGQLMDGGCDNIINYFFDKSFKLKKSITSYKDEYDDLLEKYKQYTFKHEKELNKAIDEKNCYKVENQELRNELYSIYNSKTWKFIERIKRILRK